MAKESRIQDALGILRSDGWTKWQFEDNGQHCVIGAVSEAYGAKTEGDKKRKVPKDLRSSYRADLRSIRKTIRHRFGVWTIAMRIPGLPDSWFSFNDQDMTDFKDIEVVMEYAQIARAKKMRRRSLRASSTPLVASDPVIDDLERRLTNV